MAETTAISWADSTANLWIGCQKVSPACDHCYAEELMDSRYGRVSWGPHGDRQLCKSGWQDIRRWQGWAFKGGAGVDPRLGRRRRIFINSLSDFFDNHRSVVWREDAWNLFRQCPDLIFMLLTKRPQNIAGMLPPFWDEIAERVWLLTTAENQEEANRRVPALLGVTATHAPPAVFGLSCEPLLGEIDLESAWAGESCIGEVECWGDCAWCSSGLPPLHNCRASLQSEAMINRGRSGIDWVIAGGESGRNARPSHPDWFVRLEAQCRQHEVAFHFKQWGEFAADQIGPEDARSISLPIGHVEFKRVGKKQAGRKLFGVEHLGFPDAP